MGSNVTLIVWGEPLVTPLFFGFSDICRLRKLLSRDDRENRSGMTKSSCWRSQVQYFPVIIGVIKGMLIKVILQVTV